jgi:hypothetical protein
MIDSRFPLPLAIAAVLALSSIGCLSLPVDREPIDQIAAVGWMSPNQPIAFAQHMVLYRGWYPLSPDGPGVFESHSSGSLVLVTSRDRMEIPFSPGRRFWLERAAFAPQLKAFVAVVNVEDRKAPFGLDRCLLVATDGTVTDCQLPHPLRDFEFSFDGTELLVTPEPHTAESPRAFNYLTGLTRDLPPGLERLLLTHYQNLPILPQCSLTTSRFSPDGSQLAVGCTGSREDSGVWILVEGREPMRVLPIPPDVPPLADTSFVLSSFYTVNGFLGGLAWSPDSKRLYFCGTPGALGYLIHLDGEPPTPHRPCMTSPEWSPDGTQIAGNFDNKLVAWSPPEPKPTGAQ